MRRFSIGAAIVDPAANEVQKEGAVIRLEPKAVEVLCLLASRARQTVNREEIFASVWPGTAVTEDSIIRCVSQLRKAFGDPGLIEAITKRGYRLTSVVTYLDDADARLAQLDTSADKSAAGRLPTGSGWQKHLRWAIPVIFGLTAALALCGNPMFPYLSVNAAIVIATSLIGAVLAPAIARRLSEF